MTEDTKAAKKAIKDSSFHRNTGIVQDMEAQVRQNMEVRRLLKFSPKPKKERGE